ncbi:hypothetical protein J2T58_002095 [Methanocalculus alkaliphilus]|uniref:hypothetical protein n=1 Tax=Methanocalculus alkaliphilus TaxID=768730 RepID=UPI0020A148BD|nr:hypothetical protein [Methanocalculus alkaliphilus]MCP1716219.1 hypothetical protein [Methanocalculus alkaliphilus]
MMDLKVAVEVILRIWEEIGDIDIRRAIRRIPETIRDTIRGSGGTPPPRLKERRKSKRKR